MSGIITKLFGPKQPSDTKAKMPGPSADSVAVGFGQLLWGWKGKDTTIADLKKGDPTKGLYGKVNNILSHVTTVIPEANGKKGIRISDVNKDLIQKVNDELVKNINKNFNPIDYTNCLITKFAELASLQNKNVTVNTDNGSPKTQKILTSGEIKIIIEGAYGLSELIETLENKNLNINTNSLNNIASLAESLEKISKDFSYINFDNINEIINDLIKFFEDNENTASLEKLFVKIDKVNKSSKDFTFDNIKTAMETVVNSAKLFDANLKVDSKAQSKLNRLIVLFDENGPITELIDNLKKISIDVEDQSIRNSINVLDNFFNMVSSLGDIKLRHLLRSKISINFIKSFLSKDVNDLILKVKEFESIDKDLRNSFDTLDSFFDSIKNLGEIGPINKLRMKLNILFINRFLMNDFRSIFKTLNRIAQGKEDTMKTIVSIKDVIDSIFKMSEIDKAKKKEIRKGAKFIKKFVKNDLGSIFTAINKTLKTESEDGGELRDRIAYSLDILNDIIALNDSFPSLSDAIKATIKANMLFNETQEIKYLLKSINKWELLNSDQEKLLTTNLIKYFTAFFNINEVISKSFDKKILRTLLYLQLEINKLGEILNQMADMNKNIKSSIKFTKVKSTLYNLHEVFDLIKDDYDTEISKVNTLCDLIINVKSILGILTDDKEIVSDVDTAINIIENDIVPFIEQLKEHGTLHNSFANIFEIDKNAISKIDNLISIIEKMNKLSKVAVSAKLSNIGLSAIEVTADKIKVIIGKLSDIDQKDIEKSEKTVKAFSILVATSAMILIFGSMAMGLINISDLLAFTVSLSVFLYALTGVFKLISKSLDHSLKGAQDAVILVAGAGMIMILGGMLMQLIDPAALGLFIVSLIVFLLGIGGAFKLFHKGFENAMDGAQDAMIIVGNAAAIMILGSFFTRFIDILNLSLFTFGLTVFLLEIGGAFWLVHEGFENSMKGAKDAMIIVGAAAAILIFGSLSTRLIGWEYVLGFTVGLGLFIFAISKIFLQFNKLSENAMKGAKEAAILVGISGAILILGGLSMKYIDFGLLALFGVTLAVFLLGLLTIFKVFNKYNIKAMKGAKDAAILVGISGAILILGGLTMRYIDFGLLALFAVTLAGFLFALMGIFTLFNSAKSFAFKGAISAMAFVGLAGAVVLLGALIVNNYPDLWIDAAVFAGIVFGFSLIVIGIAYLLEKNQARIWSAVAVMGVMMLLTLAAGYVLGTLVSVSNMITDWENFRGTLITMGVVIGALLAIAYVVGNPEIVGYVLLGEVAMAAMVGIIWLLGQAVSSIAEGIDDLARVSHSDIDFGNLIKLLAGFGMLVAPMLSLSAMLPVIGLGAVAMLAMKNFVYNAADIIEKFSSLKIPIYENGKLVGYNLMTEDDFDAATLNIKSIISTLVNAIKEAYSENKEIFDVGFTDIFTGGTPFAKVVRSLKTMGPMLSSIAKSIKDWSNLRIPIYEGTKIVGYETITSDSFVLAAENIRDVILTLGTAVMSAYYMTQDDPKLKGMFDIGWGDFFTGGTPFAKVSKALKTMGPMLSSIAYGIKDWSNLRIPIYKDAKVVGYETISKGNFKKASENIQEVILTLGSAIIGAYEVAQSNDYTRGMFNPESFLGISTNRSKFSMVTRAFKTMGPMLTSIAQGIKEWVALKIPEKYDSKGNVISYMTITEGDLTKAAENIQKVLTCIGTALVNTVKGNKDIFADDLFKDSPAIVAANAMKLMGETLNMTAMAVASYASGKFPIFDKDGKYVKDLEVELSDPAIFTKATNNIQAVLECLGNALLTVVKDEKNKELFNDGLFKDAPAIVAANAVKNMSEALNNTITAIKNLSELKIDDIINALDPTGPDDNIYHKLVSLLNCTINIYKLFAEPDDQAYGKTDAFLWWGDNPMSFATYLDEHNDDIKNANKALNTFTEMLSNLISKFGSIGTSYKQNFGGFNQLKNIYNALRNSFYHIINIINFLGNENNKILYDYVKSNENRINKGIDSTTSVINNLLSKLQSIKNKFENIKEFELTDLKNLIYKFSDCINTLQFLNGSLQVTGTEDLENISNYIDANKLNNDLNQYADTIERILEIAERSQEIGDKGYNILRDGILKIYSVTDAIERNENFEKHTEDLERYIKAINSIDLSRITKLTGLVDAMNMLSSRLGNLDNLTDAISDRLSVVLLELVNQLRKAEASIYNAHELQKKRKKLIEDSIEKVKSIMKDPMVVEIKQQDPETEGNTSPNFSVNSVDRTGATTDDTTSIPPGSDKELSNPENADVKQQKAKSVAKDVRPLTLRDFMDAMRQNFSPKVMKNGEYTG